ncbi:hypothetical protein C0J52_11718 [Blattella germanica]|nr:hypothetical protein C0J52_11718 [Blattella germanica]
MRCIITKVKGNNLKMKDCKFICKLSEKKKVHICCMVKQSRAISGGLYKKVKSTWSEFYSSNKVACYKKLTAMTILKSHLSFIRGRHTL